MIPMPRYKSPVSLIPGGCLQFLDFAFELSRLGRMRRAFYEEDRPGSGGRHDRVLHCLHEVEGCMLDMVSGQPYDASYELDGRKCLDLWWDQWIPVPFLRLNDQKWPDGGPKFDSGPGNWARARISRAEDDPATLRLVLAFDMTLEEPGEEYAALAPQDMAAHATFQLANHVRDNAWLLNAGWVDDWLFALFEKAVKRPNEERCLEYLASYLVLLDVLKQVSEGIVVQVVNPARDIPIDVDLVLDIGNSRTSGILVETVAQRTTNLNDSYLLQLRDLSRPGSIYTEPFETRVEFSEASFGNNALSRRSGRRTPAFNWPSVVRVGPEASRLSTLAVCAEGPTGLSSPKRYLWDERTCQQSWRRNTGGDAEPMATFGLLGRQINSHGTPLICFDDPLCKKHPLLRRQEREVAFEAHYSRSSLMLFMLVEILLQALTTINSPGQRSRRELPNVARRLRRVIFTVPSGMPVAEQRIYRRWVGWAVRVLWETLGWQNMGSERGGKPDYRLRPDVRCDWDEATCTQLVFLYNELNRKFQGDAHHLFRLVGTDRREYEGKPTVRIATIDIGGGTTDLSITTFVLESGEGDSPRIRPRPEFRDGFNLAGDDVLRDVIKDHVLSAIGDAAVAAGVRDKETFLAQLFGRDVMDSTQESRNHRAQFARQVAVPTALAMLAVYEKADLLAGSGAVSCTLGDVFRSSQESRCAVSPPEGEGSRADSIDPILPFAPATPPGDAVVRYVEDAVERATGAPFRLFDTPLRMDPRSLDLTVSEALARPLADLCEVSRLYDCDVLLLTGRPSRWSGIIGAIFAKLPVPPDRIVPMCRFRVGNWYPFADALGNISDPKTTVVVGAILCALAEGHLEGFSFDVSSLGLKSTARFIGEMDINGQITRPKVWFTVNVDSDAEQELSREVMFASPISVGFRQLEVERWTTTRFYMVDFATEQARRAAAGKLPYRLNMRLIVAGKDPDVSTERDEGELFIESIEAADGSSVSVKDVEVRLQTLPLGEGYWLDTGIVCQAE